jgi:hypothetical protein
MLTLLFKLRSDKMQLLYAYYTCMLGSILLPTFLYYFTVTLILHFECYFLYCDVDMLTSST